MYIHLLIIYRNI